MTGDKRETIGSVELTREDGTTSTFAKKDAPTGGTWRTMDCIDCHNRPTHIFRTPEDELDPSLPFIPREGLKALQATYTSQEDARTKVSAAIDGFYKKEHPDTDPARVAAAASELGGIYSTNVYPAMNIGWGTYPSHLGHMSSPGCFRCHDGEHTDPTGATISPDCETCHALLATDENDPEILKALKR